MSKSCLLSEEQFLCCICLDVFTKPVTIPCGHNFCKSCITQHWDVNKAHCQCPLCKKHFPTRPELTVNTFISEMAAEFRGSAGNKGAKASEIKAAKAGDVPCDICTRTKLKALKTCLTCLASYCGVHLDPHLTAERLNNHSLVDPVENMEDRVCSEHRKPLELFCKTDGTYLCSLCAVSGHAAHGVVSLKDECEAKSAVLRREKEEIQQMIGERQQKIQQVQRLKAYSKEDAEREITNGIQIFTTLMQSAERHLNELMEEIEERQRKTEQQADHLIGELQLEISALKMKTTEIQQLCQTQDHLLLLRSAASMNVPLGTKIWTGVSVRLPSYEGTVVKAVDQLEELLSVGKQKLLHEAKMKRVQRYAVDLTLRADTANPWLLLSDDGKQVMCGEVMRNLPDNQERFSLYPNVLAQQSFSSGRFYYEVQVTGKTDWTVGVVKSSVNRKEVVPLCPVNGYWAVGLRNGNEFLTLGSPVASIVLKPPPQRVGVFVSHEEGLVSFYDADTEVHLFSFTDCCFSEELSPFFCPGLHHGGRNANPLVIAPVEQTDRS